MRLNINDTKLVEYVKNIEETNAILKKHNFNINPIDFEELPALYQELAKKVSRYNKYLYDYYYIVTIDRKKFIYSEGCARPALTEENQQDKILGCLNCYLLDYQEREQFPNDDDLIREMGITSYSHAVAYLKSLNKDVKRLEKIFTQDELKKLCRNIQL